MKVKARFFQMPIEPVPATVGPADAKLSESVSVLIANEPEKPKYQSRAQVVLKGLVTVLPALLIGALEGQLILQRHIRTWKSCRDRPLVYRGSAPQVFIRLCSWSPPVWLIAAAWVILQLSIGVGAFIVALAHPELKVTQLYRVQSMWWFYVGVVLTAIPHPAVFIMHSFFLQTIISALLVAVFSYVGYAFYQIRRVAGLLMVPIVLWCSVVTVLGIQICTMNTQRGMVTNP